MGYSLKEVHLTCDGLSLVVGGVIFWLLRRLSDDDFLLREKWCRVLPLEVGNLRQLMLQPHDLLLIISITHAILTDIAL